MDVDLLPATVHDFLMERLRRLPSAARLVVVFDPGTRLSLETPLTLDGVAWNIVVYDGNDLAFRRAYNLSGYTLVLVTNAPLRPGGQLDVSSLADVWRSADDLIDASLAGILQALVPAE